MDDENRVIGAKAFGMGDWVLHMMGDSRTGIVGLAGISGIYE